MGEVADAGGSHQYIGQRWGCQMSAFDEGGTGTKPNQGRSSALHGGDIVHRSSSQDSRLIQVGCDQNRQGEQVLPQDLLRLRAEQARARGRYHHRVDHERAPAIFPYGSRYQADQPGLGQHPGLECGRRKIFRQGYELGAHHRVRHRLHGADAPGVLRGERHDNGSSEHTELLEGLEIGLNPGAAAGIRAGDGQCDLHRVSISMSSSLQTLIRDLHRRRGRERRGLALAEGVRLVEEALAGGIAIRGAAVSSSLESTTRGNSLKVALAERGITLENVTDPELEALADTEHPQGVVAVIEPRRWGLGDIRLVPGTTLLVLDGVQDPGNVGTMLRSALGLGATALVALKGTADLTNPKVIRAAMGASFRLPAVAASPEEFVAWAQLQRSEIWVADSNGELVELVPGRSADRPPVALVVGNEGAGVSAPLELAAHRRVAIALSPGVESLNVGVAAGILLYEVTRER